MQVHLTVTEAELAEMKCSAEQLREAVLENLDGGVKLVDGNGTIYLAGFGVSIGVAKA